MQLTLEHRGLKYSVAVAEAKSIAIKLDFEGPQPNHFGTEKASTQVLQLGDFRGDTKQGGSCNVDTLQMIPHCNGTHTETVGHIINEDIWVGHAAMDVLSVAMLVTVSPIAARLAKVSDDYRPALEETDKIITRAMLNAAVATVGDVKTLQPSALIVRTLPNTIDKCSRAYNAENAPPFFTIQAMQLINELGVRHLLVDFPSVDRMYDDGLLTNHHLFWNVPEKSHQLTGETWQDKTITEMVFVEDEIEDGVCVLNLQVPALCSDAAPSRPMILPATVIKS
ncbi:MAG: arylformamidase [Mariniblastus sp.]|jgi:arylformamidase